jgi:tRNA-dihydrouridine synthase
VPPAPTIQEKCQTMRDHFQNIVRFDGERRAVMEFRKRVSWYAKQMTPCKLLREGMREINSAEDFERVLATFLERRLEHDEYERSRRERGEGADQMPAEEAVEAA